MSRHDGLSQWHRTVSTNLPTLTYSEAYVLALWSYGIVLARSCGMLQRHDPARAPAPLQGNRAASALA